MAAGASVSVIVPTYQRLSTLRMALESLQSQTMESFEILVVDNAAEAAVKRMVDDFNREARVPVRYVAEPQLGLHHARHAGARVARGDILVFTDDDATFDKGWLRAYADAFDAHPDMAAAGGPVRPVWAVPPPAWLLELAGDIRQWGYLSLMEPYDTFRLDNRGFFYGVNMAMRRSVLFDLGGFNPECFGDKWLGDGESGLNRKVWDRNMLIGYIPSAVVHHVIPSTRMTPGYHCLRSANQGASDMYTEFHRTTPSPWRLLNLLLSDLFREGGKWIRASRARRRNDADVYSIRAQMEAARSLSKWKYAWRILWSRQFRRLVARQDWLNDVSKCERSA